MEYKEYCYDDIKESYQAAHSYFSKNIPDVALCQDFIQHCMQLCDTGDRLVSIDTKKYICTLSHQDWQTKTVIWGSIKTPLLLALQEFILIYEYFLPSIKKYYPHGIENITMLTITAILLDMTTLMDVYAEYHTKRGPKKYREVHTPYGVYTHYKPARIGVIQETSGAIDENLKEDSKIIHLTSIHDVVAYINRSTFPVRISPYGVMSINKSIGLKISDLLSPCMYTFNHIGQQYTFDILIKNIIAKRGNNIDDKVYIEENIGRNLKNGDISTLYRAIIKNIKKIYLAQTGKHLTLQYDDGSEVKYDRLTTHISMTLSKLTPKTPKTTPTKQHTYYPGKKKILKNNPNDTIHIGENLRISLGYKKQFASTLQTFCEHYIIREKIVSPITILALAQYRMSISPAQIAEFFAQRNLKYCILALDHILENYLSDKHTSYKDRRQVSIASK